MRSLVVVALLATAAHAGELDDIRKAAPACDPVLAHCFAIHVHVAQDETGFVATPAWIATQLAKANHHFAELDVSFQVASVDSASAMHVETRADRDALAKGRLTSKVIHVFVVGQLEDVDVANTTRYGVVWRRPKDPRRYIILSAQAWDRTLAHELGHFFGLPHSTYPISIMNKTERTEPPMDQRRFADEEFAAMRLTLRRLLRDKVIVAVKRR